MPPIDHLSAAMTAHQKGDFSTAIPLYRTALEGDSRNVTAWLNLALALRSHGQSAQAIPCFDAALSINPRIPGAHLALGAAFKDLGRLEEAAQCCSKEILLNPLNADAHYNLGLARQNQDLLPAAAQAYKRALEINPRYVDALVNLGCLHQQQDDPAIAIGCFEQALSIQPDLPRAHWSLARALLLLGDYERGFAEHEWRWRMRDFTTPVWNFPQPLWQGEPLGGRTILLHAEQGAGDTLQFIRYVHLVASLGARIIVGCPSSLARLVHTIPDVSAVSTSRENLPPFDTHAPVMSLPRLFKTTLSSIPAKTPYLAAPPNDQIQLPPSASPSHRLRLGLVWAGGMSDRKRDVPIAELLPLLRLEGVSFYSLQVGPPSRDIQRLPSGSIIDTAGLIKDFADTAGLINQLDGVLTVDTSVAHLAGALGRPVWTLLQYAPDWRWLRHRSESPWYPSMRLFRQSAPGEWKSVVAKVATDLQRVLQSPSPSQAFAALL